MKMHPLPQFERSNWRSLDGKWQFVFDDDDLGQKHNWAEVFPQAQSIVVPYSYETKASGIGDSAHHAVVWYHRTFTIVDRLESQHVYLNFGGVDYGCTVYLNGHQVGEHFGGYTHFAFDVTAWLIPGDNQLTVRVTDSTSVEQPRGKQRWRDENFECWYEQTTGIWKPVWLECTALQHINELKVTPLHAQHEVVVEASSNMDIADGEIKFTVAFKGQEVAFTAAKLVNHRVKLTIPLAGAGEPAGWGVHEWRPDSPELYDLTVTLSKDSELLDTVSSYFGLREIEIRGNQILLNGTPLYQRLVLDQNYWPDSGLTPQSEEAMAQDIKLIQQLGYNGVRMHMTVADQRFLTLADRAGLLIWSEMPATYTFSDDAASRFVQEWQTVVRQNYNHPAIITWVPFNESWGIPDVRIDKRQQALTQSVYYLTKAIDPQRPVITNDGWEHTCSDILTIHDYEASGSNFAARYHDLFSALAVNQSLNGAKAPFANGFEYHGQPVIISEFGGIAFADGNGWGYGDQVSGQKAFLERFDEIHKAIQQNPAIVGYCYTQLTDVSQEVNGVMTIMRQPKVSIDAIRRINMRRV